MTKPPAPERDKAPPAKGREKVLPACWRDEARAVDAPEPVLGQGEKALSAAGMTLDDFDFDLPNGLIAQRPAASRSGARLLDATADGAPVDRTVADFPELILPGDLLVFNDTRVVKARLFGQKETGGHVEILIERIDDPCRALAQIRASKAPKPGQRIVVENAAVLTVTGRDERFFTLELSEGDFHALIERCGRVPLPPYITHPADDLDETRYQTVYARHPGAVAAPTAGLHFDEALLARLSARGADLAWLTLHVGAGTFLPVQVHRIAEHRMHVERFNLPLETVRAVEAAKRRGSRVIAVGTTSLRALEAAGQSGRLEAGWSKTDLFITPGYPFRIVDALLTNFHLPKSTLLMLVSAFAGREAIRRAYAVAIERGYRFFSYGDAMFLARCPHGI